MSEVVKVRFWGVRGSIPCCTPETSRYGGDTACIEISCGDDVIVIDGGSGIRHLGLDLIARGTEQLDLFVTHYHFDHLCGMPFFCSAYNPNVKVRAHGPILDNGVTLHDSLSKLMEPPLFPVTTTLLTCTTFSEFTIGETMELDNGAKIQTIRLNHPGGACGYRIEWKGRVIAIVTDFEHEAGGLGEDIKAFVSGADLMVFDAMYTAEDYPKYVGWGHSTDDVCLQLAKETSVKQSILFHHAPYRTDEALDQIQAHVNASSNRVTVGRQGMVIELPANLPDNQTPD